jgi:LysM repeat protein
MLLVLLIWGASALSQVPPSEACSDRVVVGSRESLEDIAERCGVPIGALLAANPDLNNNPESVYPGLVLVVPRAGAQAEPQLQAQPQQETGVMTPVAPEAQPQIPVTGAEAAPAPANPEIIIIDYTVQPGDTLFALALEYNTTVQDIMDYNPELTDPDMIDVGQRLLIPDPPR